MKNELDPWEVGIAEQIKGKEFSFDPQAFADFENLLEAETLGQEPGHQAQDAAGEIMSAGGSSSVSLPIILLAIGLAGMAYWWNLSDKPAVMEEPAVTISAPLPASPPELAPAAPPTSTVSIKTQKLREVSELGNSSPESAAAPATPPELTANEDSVISEEELAGEAPDPPRVLRATSRVATLPIRPVIPIKAASISLPTVQKPTPSPVKRDRKTLFPDVIKKN